MNGTFEIEFASAKQAAQALKLLNGTKTDELTRARIKGKTNGNKLTINISSGDFTALRALTTTAMRDLKVVIDTFAAIEKS